MDATPSPSPRRAPELLAAGAWGFAEATLFFLVPDVLLGWIALRHGWRRALPACLAAALGATIGGAALYAWSSRAPAPVERVVEQVPAVPAGAVDLAEADLRRPDWPLVATLGAVSNRPFKLFAAAAPRAGIGLPAFAALTPAIRLPRFLMVSLVLAVLGALLRPRLPGRVLLGVYAAAWTLFYAAFWLLSPW